LRDFVVSARKTRRHLRAEDREDLALDASPVRFVERDVRMSPPRSIEPRRERDRERTIDSAPEREPVELDPVDAEPHVRDQPRVVAWSWRREADVRDLERMLAH
jgi:hypothetical protein